MIRIFQTGDNHIGINYRKHRESELLKKARLDSLRVCVGTANREGCHIFAVTGDLFDSVRIDKRTVEQTVSVLSGFSGEAVVVIAGNHDYCSDSSKVWKYFTDCTADNDRIMLLSRYKPYPLDIGDERVILYPAFCDELHSDRNRLSWIKERDILSDDADYRIGLAHGAVEGLSLDSEGRYFLMTREELSDIPVDLWLVGHTHVEEPRSLSFDEYTAGHRIYNAGTHCQANYANDTEGCCFVIELEAGKAPLAKKVQTGTLRFHRVGICAVPRSDSAPSLEDYLTGKLKFFGDSSVVEVLLSGSAVQEDYEGRNEIYTKVLSRFVEGSIRDSELNAVLTERFINAEFSEESLPAKLVRELLADPKEAQLAYELIKSIAKAKR